MAIDLLNYLELVRVRAMLQQQRSVQALLLAHPVRMMILAQLRPFKRLWEQQRLRMLTASNRPPEGLPGNAEFEIARSAADPRVIDVHLAGGELNLAGDMACVSAPVRLASGHRKLIIVHAYYEAEAEVLFDLAASFVDYDVVVTTPKSVIREAFLRRFGAERAVCWLVPNVGRDVLPFLLVTAHLDLSGYDHFVKVHTKRSQHLDDGGWWFYESAQSLLGNPYFTDAVCERMAPSLPAIYGCHTLPLQDHLENNRHWLTSLLGGRPEHFNASFVAGTMFVGTGQYLRELAGRALHRLPFEAERGQLDGCLAHALERYFGYLAQAVGGECATLETFLKRPVADERPTRSAAPRQSLT